MSSLPLMNNPSIKLAHNKEQALKVYNQQIKNIYQNTDYKKDVIESEEKLQQLGYVDYVRNLKSEQQEMLIRSEIQNLRETAGLSAKEYPKVNQVVQNDIYVDDCLLREENVEKALERADDLELMLNGGGFTLKGITFTGGDPPSALSSVNVAGMKWFLKTH